MLGPSNSHESMDEPQEESVSEPDQHPVQSGDEQGAIKRKENWFLRWWNEGVDKRGSSRESLPWIVAFFFSGGPPQMHEIRNISLGGVHVYTDERWHRGTIVRMTLSDRRELVGSKSITVNAMAVRSTSDGVGLQFIFIPEPKRRRGALPIDPGPLVNVTRTQFKEFLHALKTASG